MGGNPMWDGQGLASFVIGLGGHAKASSLVLL
jgi:hypothetical protein